MASSGPQSSGRGQQGERLLQDACTHPTGLGTWGNWTDTQFSIIKMLSLSHEEVAAHSAGAAGEGLEAGLRLQAHRGTEQHWWGQMAGSVAGEQVETLK